MDTVQLKTSPLIRQASRTDCELIFKPITRDSLPLIVPFLHRQMYRTCDFSIGGLYIWVDYFEYEYCICQETLFIKGGEEENLQNTAFAIPVGALSLPQSLALLQRYCTSRNVPLILSAVPEPAAKSIQQLYHCRITELPDWGDYLYSVESLVSLAGKRLQKKRNRINKFKSDYPNHTFETITSRNLPEIIAFFESYRQEYQKEKPLFIYEEGKVAQVLREYDTLPFEGGVLRIDGGIAAFSIGEVINDTLIVHIEKARKEIPGTYESINQLFAAQMAKAHPEIRYINREDDAGDPGLRQAKLSYNPKAILKKYNIALIR